MREKSQIFIRLLDEHFCWLFWKSLTRDMTSYWQEGCITDFHGDTFPTLFLSYFAQKVGEGPLDPPPALSLSVLGIRTFSFTQEKRSDPYVWRLSQSKKNMRTL